MGISRSEKSLGYSATQVSGAQIEQAQTNNAMQALQGKVAGLQIQETGSGPGSAPNVNIRGLGSINGSNQPLYVVDVFLFRPLRQVRRVPQSPPRVLQTSIPTILPR